MGPEKVGLILVSDGWPYNRYVLYFTSNLSSLTIHGAKIGKLFKPEWNSSSFFLHFRISDILRLRRLQRMLPAATDAATDAAGASSAAATLPPFAAPPPAGPPRLNGGGSGRLLPMLHHQRFVSGLLYTVIIGYGDTLVKAQKCLNKPFVTISVLIELFGSIVVCKSCRNSQHN